MAKKKRKFADDGWAVWVDGDDTSTVYINDWLNQKEKSYVDLAIRVRGIKVSKSLHVYVPFAVSTDEIEEALAEKYKPCKTYTDLLSNIFASNFVEYGVLKFSARKGH